MDCKYCKSPCIKAGRSRTGTQRHYCKVCRTYQQTFYAHRALMIETNNSITTLLTEGVGIRSIARILHISITTIVSRIKTIANKTVRPHSVNQHGIFEIDELWIFVGNKNNATWIICPGSNRKTGDRFCRRLAYPRTTFTRHYCHACLKPFQSMYRWITSLPKSHSR